jgi:hypothetical protein
MVDHVTGFFTLHPVYGKKIGFKYFQLRFGFLEVLYKEKSWRTLLIRKNGMKSQDTYISQFPCKLIKKSGNSNLPSETGWNGLRKPSPLPSL